MCSLQHTRPIVGRRKGGRTGLVRQHRGPLVWELWVCGCPLVRELWVEGVLPRVVKVGDGSTGVWVRGWGWTVEVFRVPTPVPRGKGPGRLLLGGGRRGMVGWHRGHSVGRLPDHRECVCLRSEGRGGRLVTTVGAGGINDG